MNSVIFYSMAEYCNNSGKMTITWKNREVVISIWESSTNKTIYKVKKYYTSRGALTNYKIMLGEAILGGWKVLNAFPKYAQ